MRVFALLLLVPFVVFADVRLRQGGVYVGPVTDLDCGADAGLSCSRDAGTSIGKLTCNAASATEPGCVTPTAQTLAGTKTLTGDLRLSGHVHASLTACAAGTKGTWQTCTTHNSPVFCDGTSNLEFAGSLGSESVLVAFYVNGIPTPIVGGFTVSSTTGGTITAVMGTWGAGTGAGSVPIAFLHTGGTCTCTIDCDVPGGRTACSGSCTLAAGASVGLLRGTSTCTLDPYVNGNLNVMWTSP